MFQSALRTFNLGYIKPRTIQSSIRLIQTSSNKMSKKLAGKVAIITASTDGIGLAIASRLGQDGAKIVISSRKQSNVDKAVETLTSQGSSVVGVVCHVAKEDHRQNLINTAISKFGGIDILVSNAAVNPHMGGVLDCPGSAWDKIFEVNVKNALQMSQLVVPEMMKRKGGSIVFVSSIAGFQPFSLLGAYSVSKTALLGLTKALAQQVAIDNIRVNCLCPGIINTKFSNALTANEMVLDKMLEHIPMGRLGEPHEMGGLVSFLSSDDSSYVTGESFVISGGMSSRL